MSRPSPKSVAAADAWLKRQASAKQGVTPQSVAAADAWLKQQTAPAAPPPPVSAQRTDRVARDIEKILPLVSPAVWPEVADRAASTDDAELPQALERSDDFRKKAKQAFGAARKFASDLFSYGMDSGGEEVLDAATTAWGATEPVRAPVVTAGKKALEILDLAHKHTARRAAAAVEGKSGPLSSEEWEQFLDKRKNKPPIPPTYYTDPPGSHEWKPRNLFSNPLGHALDLLSVPAAAIAGAGAVPVAAVDAASDYLTTDKPVSYEAALKHRIEDWTPGVTNTLATIATDPVTAVTGGLGTSRNATQRIAQRVARRAMKGATQGERAAFAADVVKVSEAGAGLDAMPALERVAKKHGVPRAEMAKAFGDQAEFLGRAQFAVAGLEPGALLEAAGAPAHLGKRAVRKVLKPIVGEHAPWSATRMGAEVASLRARGTAVKAERDLRDLARKSNELAPDDPARREWLVENIIDPPGPLNPAAMQSVTNAEIMWIHAQDEFFEAAHKLGTKGGYFDKPPARNPHTGRYFPRMYEDAIDPAVILQSHPINLAVEQSRKQRVRLVDHERYQRGFVDPAEVVPAYAKRVSGGIGMVELEGELVRRFGQKAIPADPRNWVELTRAGGEKVFVPRIVNTIMSETFTAPGAALRRWIRSRAWPHEARQVALGTVNLYSTLLNYFKRQRLFKRPAYMALNAMNDSMMSLSAGNVGFLEKFSRGAAMQFGLGGEVLLPSGRRLSGNQVLRLAERNGLPVVSRSSPPPARAAEALRDLFMPGKNAARAADASRADEVAFGVRKARDEYQALAERGKRKLSGGAKRARAWRWARKLWEHKVPIPGEQISRFWESNAKLSHFIYELEKGTSPALAATRTMETLLDYGTRGSVTAAARWLFPFATWMVNAPQSVARTFAAHPGGPAAALRFMQQDRDAPAPLPLEQIQTQGPSLSVSPRTEQTYSNVRTLLAKAGAGAGAVARGEDPRPAMASTEAPLRPGHRVRLQPRDPVSEALENVTRPLGLTGSPEVEGWTPGVKHLVGQMSPLVQAGIEVGLDYDPRRERESTMTAYPFPPEAAAAGLVPDALAGQGGGWASKWVLPMLVGDQWTEWLINQAAYARAGGADAGAQPFIVGAPRDYVSPDGAATQDRLAGTLSNALFGVRLSDVGPLDEYSVNVRLARELAERLAARAKKLEAAKR